MSTLEYATPARKASAAVAVNLSIMMFLQYAVWGVWLPYIANYLGKDKALGGLGFSGGQIGWILGLAGSIGAISAPFIAGQIADRYLNAEKALAILLLVGGVVKFATAYTTDYYGFMALSIVYSIVYMPTLSLTNSICFQNLRDPEKTFPPIRLWGTIGWIVASVAFSWLWLHSGNDVTDTARIADSLKVAGVASMLYAVFAMVALPATPPKKDVAHPLAFARAFGLLLRPDFLLVTLVALPIAMIHQCYFFRAGPYFEDAIGVSKQYLGAVMGIGQASEIFFLVILGLLIKRLGYKWVLILGCLAYAARFAIFAVGNRDTAAMVIAAQSLHGLCYGCFFAGSFLYVEKVAPKDARHSAQTVFGIVILGLGPVLAGVYNQYFDRFKVPSSFVDKSVAGMPIPMTQGYHEFWWAEAGIAVLCAVVLAVAFWPKAEPRVEPATTT